MPQFVNSLTAFVCLVLYCGLVDHTRQQAGGDSPRPADIRVSRAAQRAAAPAAAAL